MRQCLCLNVCVTPRKVPTRWSWWYNVDVPFGLFGPKSPIWSPLRLSPQLLRWKRNPTESMSFGKLRIPFTMACASSQLLDRIQKMGYLQIACFKGCPWIQPPACCNACTIRCRDKWSLTQKKLNFPPVTRRLRLMIPKCIVKWGTPLLHGLGAPAHLWHLFHDFGKITSCNPSKTLEIGLRYFPIFDCTLMSQSSPQSSIQALSPAPNPRVLRTTIICWVLAQDWNPEERHVFVQNGETTSEHLEKWRHSPLSLKWS